MWSQRRSPRLSMLPLILIVLNLMEYILQTFFFVNLQCYIIIFNVILQAEESHVSYLQTLRNQLNSLFILEGDNPLTVNLCSLR